MSEPQLAEPHTQPHDGALAAPAPASAFTHTPVVAPAPVFAPAPSFAAPEVQVAAPTLTAPTLTAPTLTAPPPPAAPAQPGQLADSFRPLVQPSSAAAVLDIAAPLSPAMAAIEQQPGYQQAHAQQLSEHHAMPVYADADSSPAGAAIAMPAPAASPSMRPAAIGGVAAADLADLNELRAQRAQHVHAPASTAELDAATGIWSLPIALYIAMFALTLQMVAGYARLALPDKIATGVQLDQFEMLLRDMPLMDSMIASFLAMIVGGFAVVMVLLGWRRGIRDRGLQVAIGAIGVLAIVSSWVVPMLAG
ncbi:MAG: hypothetical protein ABI200_07170 [Gaiellales bacterium]